MTLGIRVVTAVLASVGLAGSATLAAAAPSAVLTITGATLRVQRPAREASAGEARKQVCEKCLKER